MPSSTRRLLIIGLDSGSSEYLFGRCLPVMPNLRRILPRSWHGALRTTDPPISLPAWAVMFTGMDPGTLGIYGFRHRLDHSYTRTYAPASDTLSAPTVWTLLSDRGRRVAVIGMPPGYPPPPVNGVSISDFLTPEGATDWCHPAELGLELEKKYGKYQFDVTFRAEKREELYLRIVEMTQRRFAIAEDLYQRERWDVFAIHEVGTDRLHHAYTKYFDPEHSAYVPGNPFEHVLLDYYRQLDRSVGRLLAHIDDDTIVVIASDHGSMPMAGCFCINQWLASEGYLKVRAPPKRGTPLEQADIDWAHTSVWGAGGYYARLFFNVLGREANGCVEPSAVPALKAELTRRLRMLRSPEGNPLATRIFEPRDVYRSVTGDPPDLMVYFGELRWRSAGSLGHPSIYLKENDTGPDDAVHNPLGILMIHDPRSEQGGELATQEIINVAPTLLRLVGEKEPADMQGRPIELPGLVEREISARLPTQS